MPGVSVARVRASSGAFAMLRRRPCANAAATGSGQIFIPASTVGHVSQQRAHHVRDAVQRALGWLDSGQQIAQRFGDGLAGGIPFRLGRPSTAIKDDPTAGTRSSRYAAVRLWSGVAAEYSDLSSEASPAAAGHEPCV